ncbi:hypothetical protein ACCY16_22865 [Candidatus Pantoea formicae]|uniref:hypothetical protein n=1 Tax=Candidatus Pantoea formicae TaxID=2608355 RepID=UPI003EDB3D23
MTGIIEDGISTGAFREANAQQVARQLSAMLNGYADLLIVVQQTEAREQAINDLRAFIKLAL